MYRNHTPDFFWGALVGGTVATLTALLFTTKKGRQIQNKICELYEEAEETVENAFSKTKEKAEDMAEHAGKKVAHKAKHDDSQK